jgi:hypothetical protein
LDFGLAVGRVPLGVTLERLLSDHHFKEQFSVDASFGVPVCCHVSGVTPLECVDES